MVKQSEIGGYKIKAAVVSNGNEMVGPGNKICFRWGRNK